MKGVVFTTDGKIRTQDFGEPLYKTVGDVVGGYIEIVHPRYLPQPFVMIVNDEGRLMDLPVNTAGSLLYGIFDHGEPIVGNIVFMKEGFVNGELDIVGLTEEEIQKIYELDLFKK